MRTKTLLIAAAALAAGVLACSATTFSMNIVGYVSATYAAGYVNVAPPVDVANGNALTNFFPNVYDAGLGQGPYDYDLVSIWNATTHKYDSYTLDQAQPSGVGDAFDVNSVQSPTINPGQLMYLFNSNAKLTNTIAGTVHVDGAAPVAGGVGLSTNLIPAGLNFVASKIPVGGGVTSSLQISNPLLTSGPNSGYGVLDFSLIEIPNINASGQFKGYTISTIDSAQSTGFGDAFDVNSVVEPSIPVGTGFILDNESGNGTYQWIQSF
jgi:hypothetical protein